MSAELVNALLIAQSRMEEVRNGFEDSMQDAFNWVNPRRYDMSGTARKGAKRKTKMYDGVAQDALHTWVDGILGWVVSKPLTWQRATILDRRYREDDGVQRYFDEYTEQMRLEFHRSTFYEHEAEFLQDGGSGGTGTVITEESLDLSHAVCRVPHPARYWIEESADGEIDAYHEKTTMTARQCLQKYDRDTDTLHPTIVKWAKDPNSAGWEVTLLQCIRRSDDPIFPRRLKWSRFVIVTVLEEMHAGSGKTSDSEISDGADRLIRIEPLDYFSPTVWRCRKNSDELYGYSPAMDVLTVIEAVQQHAYNLLNLGNFAANPLMAIPEEGRTSFARLPGARFYYGSEKRLPQAVQMGGDYPIAIDREDKLHRLIYARYGYDLWRMMPMYQAKKERVQAYEIGEARLDQARLMVGQMSNLWDAGIAPIYGNIAAIAARAGRMPEAPPILQDLAGKDVVEVVPLGPLAQLQEYASSVSGLQAGLRFLAELSQIIGRNISPQMAAQIWHRVNLPDLTEFALDHIGFPQKLMRTDDEVEARMARDEEAKAAEAQAVNMQKMAAAAAQMAKPVAQNSLLAGVA